MRRYDVYGFRGRSLDDAAALVTRALGIPLTLRESSYRGLYYCAGEGVSNDYLLQSNDEEARWHTRYPEYGVTLMVNDLPEMDAIRGKLTSGRSDPVFLHSIVHEEEPESEGAQDEEEE